MAGGESFREQLRSDAWFLQTDAALDTDTLDTLVLQLNRIHPQILTDAEAARFRAVEVPARERLSGLIRLVRMRGDDACRELYRALHLHVEDVYFRLPTRLRLRQSCDARVPATDPAERFTLNEQSPLFFLSCFSVALVAAVLYYSGEFRRVSGSSGSAVLGLSRSVQELLVWCTDM